MTFGPAPRHRPPARPRGTRQHPDRRPGARPYRGPGRRRGPDRVHGGARTARPRQRAKAGHGRRGVRLRLGLDLPYPVDIADLTGEVHRRVVHQLDYLAGVEQPRVSLVVERLVPPATEAELR